MPTLLLAAAATPLVVAYVIACFRNPLRYAMGPYFVSIQFSSLIAVGPGPFGSVSTLLGLLLGAALLTQLITTRRAGPRVPLDVPVWLAFLGLSGMSLFWSIEPDVTAERFVILCSLVLLFVALVLTRFGPSALRSFENAILVGGVLVVGYGLVQVLFLGGAPTPDGGAARFGNDLLGPNNQAASLLLPVAIAAGRALTGPVRRRALHAAVLLMLLFGVLMTGSRGGLLATVVVLLAVTFLGTLRRTTGIAVGVAAVVVLIAALLANPGGVADRQLDEPTDSSGRAEIWAIAAHACRTYCLTGAGWGTFPDVYAEQRSAVPEAGVLERGTSFEAHNVYILVVIEAGLAGMLLVFLGLCIAVVNGLRLPAAMRGPPMAALLGTLVSSFFLSNLEYKYFWAVLSYVAISSTVAAAQRTTPSLGTPLTGVLPVAAGQDGR